MTAAAATGGTWGALTVAGIALALPLATLREVVPCTALSPLPCADPAVAGGLALRGVSVPVLDLGVALGRRPAPEPPPFVVLVVHEGRLLGLACEGVQGVFDAAPGSRSTVHGAEPGTQYFDGSVRRADSGALVSLLSVAALAARPGVPWIDDPEPARQLGAAAAQDDAVDAAPRERSLMLLKCGAAQLAIDAEAVHATLWQPRVLPSVLARGACRGTVDLGAHSVGAADLAALCGLPPLAGNAPQGIVLQRAEGLAALLVEQVVEILRVPVERIAPAALGGLPGTAMFQGMFRHPALGDHLVLDAAALAAHPEVAALAATNIAGSAGEDVRRGNGGHATGSARALITVRLPHEAAVPIEQVQEVLPCGGDSAMFGPDAPLRRVQLLRGRAVPVVCLARLLGGRPGEPGAMAAVLVVASGERWVGFCVPHLDAIALTRWQQRLPGTGNVVSLGGDGSRTVPLLDLQALAARFAGGELQAA